MADTAATEAQVAEAKRGVVERVGPEVLGTTTEEVPMELLNWKIMTWSVGLFCAVSFVLCVLYGLVVPRAWHLTQFLEITLPGFKWLSVGSVVLGLIETFLYGAYVGLVFTWVHNAVARRVRLHA
jgi:uncharacterized protein (DUF2062 family)